MLGTFFRKAYLNVLVNMLQLNFASEWSTVTGDSDGKSFLVGLQIDVNDFKFLFFFSSFSSNSDQPVGKT